MENTRNVQVPLMGNQTNQQGNKRDHIHRHTHSRANSLNKCATFVWGISTKKAQRAGGKWIFILKRRLCIFSFNHGSSNSSNDDQMMEDSAINGHISRHVLYMNKVSAEPVQLPGSQMMRLLKGLSKWPIDFYCMNKNFLQNILYIFRRRNKKLTGLKLSL